MVLHEASEVLARTAFHKDAELAPQSLLALCFQGSWHISSRDCFMHNLLELVKILA